MIGLITLFKHANIMPNVNNRNSSGTAFNPYKIEAIKNGVQQRKKPNTTFNNIFVILISLNSFPAPEFVFFKTFFFSELVSLFKEVDPVTSFRTILSLDPLLSTTSLRFRKEKAGRLLVFVISFFIQEESFSEGIAS